MSFSPQLEVEFVQLFIWVMVVILVENILSEVYIL